MDVFNSSIVFSSAILVDSIFPFCFFSSVADNATKKVNSKTGAPYSLMWWPQGRVLKLLLLYHIFVIKSTYLPQTWFFCRIKLFWGMMEGSNKKSKLQMFNTESKITYIPKSECCKLKILFKYSTLIPK